MLKTIVMKGSVLELWIERSRNAQLDCKIEVLAFKRMAEQVFRLLLRERYRWESITLAFKRTITFGPGFHLALTNMPSLQKLNLTFMTDEKETLTLDLSRSKQLRHLNLKQMRNRRWREITKSIQGQQLLHLQLDLEDSPRDTFLITSLTMFPQLAHLDLRLTFNYGISLLSEMPNGSPILLPKLRALKLSVGCGDLLDYFTAPSLVSLDIVMYPGTEEKAYEFIQRSKPLLEKMRWLVYGDLDIERIRSIFHKLHVIKTFILYQFDPNYTDTTKFLWQLLSTKSPYGRMLLPNLKKLDFNLRYIFSWSEKELRKLVLLLASMVLSRCRYTRDFTLHLGDICLGKAFKSLENFEDIQKRIFNKVTIGSRRQQIHHFHFP